MPHSLITQVAVSTPYDNSTDGWVSNNVQAAIEEAPIHLRGYEVSATATISAPTTNTILISIAAPATGTYLVNFSCDVLSSTAGATATFMIGVNGVSKADSVRVVLPLAGGLLSGSARDVVSTNGIVTATVGQTIEIWWQGSTTNPSTGPRTLNLLRLT